MKVRYAIQKGDFLKYYLFRVAKSRKYHLYAGVSAAVGAGYLVLNSGDVAVWPRVLLVAGFAAAVPFFVVLVCLEVAYRRHSSYGETVMTLGEEGVELRSAYGVSFLKWSGFRRFYRDGDILMLNGGVGIFLSLNQYSQEKRAEMLRILKGAPVENNFSEPGEV